MSSVVSTRISLCTGQRPSRGKSRWATSRLPITSQSSRPSASCAATRRRSAMAEEAIFRSAEMSLVQFYLSNEVAVEVVTAIGEAGNVQFRDLNSKVSAFQRTFVPQTRRLEEGLRRVRYLRQEMERQSITPEPAWEGAHAGIAAVSDLLNNLGELEKQVNELRSAEDKFLARQAELQEHNRVLNAAERFFGGVPSAESDGSNVVGQIAPDAWGGNVDIIAGIIKRETVPALERILFRSLRGNLVLSSGDISEPLYDAKSKKKTLKNTFIVVTHGKELSAKAERIAEALDAHIYPVTSDPRARSQKLREVTASLSDVSVVLQTTTEALRTELEVLSPQLEAWALRVAREKAVFGTLNLFSADRNGKLLIGEGWVPTDAIAQLQLTLRRISEAANIESPSLLTVLQTNRTPPTYHKTNKVTSAFQAMVDVYAIATYQEVNPALPTVITFPFMFAVMFGDLGHAAILTAAALVLVFNERKLAKVNYGDIFDMAYSGRYILLFMGLFAMYTGLIYNDLFSKSMTLFKSGWTFPDHEVGESVAAVQRGVYSFGLDSAWHGTDNNLLFTNSFKMKLSILLGYVHMSYSYMFSLVNAIYFQQPIDIWGNFVPGLIFFQGIFGYLSVIIVYKWCVDWVKADAAPPSLLNTLIDMFLAPGKIGEPLFRGQKPLQIFLVIAALVAVPWLLLLKPLYVRRQLQQEAHHYESVAQGDQGRDAEAGTQTRDSVDDDDEDEDTEGHNFGDVLIHQVIHTIEFCLNCVSHTASYLRLWALSLAHAQLSQVLWSMTIGGAFGFTGIVGIIMTTVLFGMWFTLTVAVLVVMEGTSAMLHALRLHWVESMSKYYIGEGKAFAPFSLRSVEL